MLFHVLLLATNLYIHWVWLLKPCSSRLGKFQPEHNRNLFGVGDWRVIQNILMGEKLQSSISTLNKNLSSSEYISIMLQPINSKPWCICCLYMMYMIVNDIYTHVFYLELRSWIIIIVLIESFPTTCHPYLRIYVLLYFFPVNMTLYITNM